MLQELINTFEALKKYVYIIDRGSYSPIIIKFKDEHFYHLIGLHKTNIDMFFPTKMHSKDKRYKHIKKNIEKYEHIILNQTKDRNSLELRLTTFHQILNLLSGEYNTNLYNLSTKVPGSMYSGDYGLLAILENIYCLLGLRHDANCDGPIYVPQSWMASKRVNKLTAGKPPMYFKKIIAIPTSIYSSDYNGLGV